MRCCKSVATAFLVVVGLMAVVGRVAEAQDEIDVVVSTIDENGCELGGYVWGVSPTGGGFAQQRSPVVYQQVDGAQMYFAGGWRNLHLSLIHI